MMNSLEASKLFLDLNALFWDNYKDSKGVAEEGLFTDSESKTGIYLACL